MPLPLAHTLVGYCVTASSGIRFRRDTSTALLFSVVVANLPDLDFLPGALADVPGLYHRGVGHTIPAAIIAGLVVAAAVTRFRGRFPEMALLGCLVYGSHLLADMVHFGGGNIGVQILWPLSDAYYAIQTPLSNSTSHLLHFARGDDTHGFAWSFVTWQFVRASLLQALLFAPLLIPALIMRSWRERRRAAIP